MTRAEPRIPRAFAGAEIGDRENRVCHGGFVRLVSNADFPISGIARRGRARRVCFSLRPVRIRAVTAARSTDATRPRFRCLAPARRGRGGTAQFRRPPCAGGTGSRYEQIDSLAATPVLRLDTLGL